MSADVAIYILRTLLQRATEIKTDLYLSFIDYTKAYDYVHHEETESNYWNN